jgi:hypothetical protein
MLEGLKFVDWVFFGIKVEQYMGKIHEGGDVWAKNTRFMERSCREKRVVVLRHYTGTAH